MHLRPRPTPLLLVFALLVGLGFAACDDAGQQASDHDSPVAPTQAPLDPRLHVAVLIPEPHETDPQTQPTMRVVVVNGGAEHTLGRGERWAWLTLAPDARHVAAVRLDAQAFVDYDDPNPLLDIFEVTGDGHATVSLPSQASTLPSWSPDGEMVAIAGGGSVHLYTSEGELAGSSSPGHATVPRRVEGVPAWSADGAYVAIPAGDRIAVVDREGSLIAESTLEALGTVVDTDPDESFHRAFVDRWDDEGRLRILGHTSKPREPAGLWAFAGALEDGAIAWHVEPADGLPSHHPGGLPVAWIADHGLPVENYRPVSSREALSGTVGSLVYWNPDPGGQVRLGALDHGTRSSLFLYAGRELHRVDVDMQLDPQWFATPFGEYFWDAIYLEAP